MLVILGIERVNLTASIILLISLLLRNASSPNKIRIQSSMSFTKAIFTLAFAKPVASAGTSCSMTWNVAALVLSML